jgi:hypothetical protein
MIRCHPLQFRPALRFFITDLTTGIMVLSYNYFSTASAANMKYSIKKARVRGFDLTPIHGALILGKNSHYGCCAAIRMADNIMHLDLEVEIAIA